MFRFSGICSNRQCTSHSSTWRSSKNGKCPLLEILLSLSHNVFNLWRYKYCFTLNMKTMTFETSGAMPQPAHRNFLEDLSIQWHRCDDANSRVIHSFFVLYLIMVTNLSFLSVIILRFYVLYQPMVQLKSDALFSLTFMSTVKVNQSHYRSWQVLRAPGGWGFQIWRQSAHKCGKVTSYTHRPPLPPGNIPGSHFCQWLSRPQDHSAAGRIISMKNSNDTI
jgi:hypothetical protein